MWCASGVKGRKKTLCQQRYRGNVKVRWFHLCSPRSSLTLLLKNSTLPLPGTKALFSPHPFSWNFSSNSDVIHFPQNYTLLLSFKAWNMTMKVRRPLKVALSKKIRSYAMQSKKVKKTRKPNCFFCSCARKNLNHSQKGYQNMRQSQRRRQNQKRT